MKFICLIIALIPWMAEVQGQPHWAMVLDKNGIKVFTKKVESSKFKSIMVQTVFEGTISALMEILCDISKHPEWAYKTKSASVIRQINKHEIIYYTESILPWPLSNRDAIIHLTMMPEPSNRVLRISAFSEPELLSKKYGLVRIRYSKASWYVTESANQLNIEYIFEIDPGGKLPGWLVNMLIEKGPYETFENLKNRLKH